MLMFSSPCFSGLLASAASAASSESQIMDVLETETVLLECRFPAKAVSGSRMTFYWIRTNRDGPNNAAIGESALDRSYGVEYDPERGRYDLRIRNATYDRDNGDFNCHINSGGKEVLKKSVALTVLLKPSRPVITPSAPHATEGRRLNLTCSSVGGSPPPRVCNMLTCKCGKDISENIILVTDLLVHRYGIPAPGWPAHPGPHEGRPHPLRAVHHAHQGERRSQLQVLGVE